MAKRGIQRWLAMVLLTTVFVGCGGENLKQVGGTVTVDGIPVTEGSITFYPTAGGRPASSFFKPDGSYLISYRTQGDGLPPGEYKVMIESKKFKHPPDADVVDRIFIRDVVPPKYHHFETTPLTQTVSEDSDQVFDFDIESESK